MSRCPGPGLCRYAGRIHAVCVDVLTLQDRMESHAGSDAAEILRQVGSWPVGRIAREVAKPAHDPDIWRTCVEEGCNLYRVTVHLGTATNDLTGLGYLVCRRCGTEYHPRTETA